MRITITVPRIPAGAWSNIVGVLGLLAAVVAVGGLAGIWWAVLAGGVVAVALSALAQAQDSAKARPTVVAASAKVRPRAVPTKAEEASA